MIEYPRPDTWAIGFLTSTTQDEGGRVLELVYIAYLWSHARTAGPQLGR